MSSKFEVTPLSVKVPFGATVSGLTLVHLKDKKRKEGTLRVVD